MYRNCCNFLKLFLVYFLLIHSVTSQSQCGTDKLRKKPSSYPFSSQIHKETTYSREANWSPIRIEVDFLNFDSSSSIHVYLKDKILNHVIQWYTNVLQIKRLTSNLKIDDSFEEISDLDVDIPDKYYSTGVEADYLFFILITSDDSVSYVGAAIHQQRDSITNQPVIGTFLINYVESNGYNSYDDLFLIAVHEMAHALVFSYELFQYYIDSSGEVYDPNDMIKYEKVRDANVQKIATPNVIKYARKTFGCSSLDGVELELTGGLGTVSQHWDKRIMYGDFMGPDINVEDYVLSDITLGLFEDSGWYLPNYEYTQQITWGYHEGCSFIEEKCIEDQKPTNDVFCIDYTKYHCDYNKLNKGTCSFVDYIDKLPEQYSYFEDSSLGGYDSYLDYCPIVRPIAGGNCRGLDAVETELNSDYGEQACENCRCVEGTYSKDNEAHDHVGCHWIECEDDHTIVHIGDEEIECPEDGGTVNVPNYNGELYCPKWIDVCNPVPCMNLCSGMGICRYGVCECPDGTMGGDCSNITKDFSYRDPITPREEDSSYIISIPITILLILS